MKLTNQEMLEQYNEAVVTEHVTDLNNVAECDSECDNCPANPACTQLAYNHEKETSDYKVFVTNFKRYILPLIPIKE